MAQTVLITLTVVGADTGPFNLYSNLDGFAIPFETGVAKLDLEMGYVSYLVPDAASTIRVQSTNVLCTNYIDLVIGSIVTTTSTTSTSSTTTTTTTLSPSEYDFYLADEYNCGDCNLTVTNVRVAFPTGTSVTIDNYYLPLGSGPFETVYRVRSSTTSGIIVVILTTDNNNSLCSSVPCA